MLSDISFIDLKDTDTNRIQLMPTMPEAYKLIISSSYIYFTFGIICQTYHQTESSDSVWEACHLFPSLSYQFSSFRVPAFLKCWPSASLNGNSISWSSISGFQRDKKVGKVLGAFFLNFKLSSPFSAYKPSTSCLQFTSGMHSNLNWHFFSQFDPRDSPMWMNRQKIYYALTPTIRMMSYVSR